MSIETWRRKKKVVFESEPTRVSNVFIFGRIARENASFLLPLHNALFRGHRPPFYSPPWCLGIEDLEQNVVSSRGREGSVSRHWRISYTNVGKKKAKGCALFLGLMGLCHVVITIRWTEFCRRVAQETRKMQHLRHDNGKSEIICGMQYTMWEKVSVFVIDFATFLITYTTTHHWTVMDESETNMVLGVIDWWCVEKTSWWRCCPFLHLWWLLNPCGSSHRPSFIVLSRQ